MFHERAIQFEDVSFSYDGIKILENVSFHIHRGEFVSLVGPNGSGKTTILKLIVGILKPDKGKIKIFDNINFKRNQIGYVPQYVDIDRTFPITVYEVVEIGLIDGLLKIDRKEAEKKINHVLGLLDIMKLKDRQFTTLSGGEKRRVLLARALVSNPELILLDEPTTNIDEESERKLFDILKSLKKTKTILVVTHDSDFVSSLTDVVFCTGKEASNIHGIKRHNFEPINGKSEYLKVIHNTEISNDCCCRKEK